MEVVCPFQHLCRGEVALGDFVLISILGRFVYFGDAYFLGYTGVMTMKNTHPVS